jgi:eukaryotic-like serine/threonine-protein kinase
VRRSVRLSPDTVLENRYQVVRQMAEGENTKVYEGRHIGLNLPIVIKQLRSLYPDPKQAQEQIEQYHEEARLLARLRHPNLVTVYDTFVSEDLPLIIMEMVRGRNLQEIGQLAPQPLAEKRILIWAGQLFETLNFLHHQHPPVIVRGLKPSNIILDSNGTLRLIDFGLAKAMDERGTRNIVKGIGEDGFAPLEQGAYSKTDERSDLYSLGATLYYLLTKEVPPSAAQRAIASKDPLADPREKNPTVGQPLWEALQKLMALRANERPANVSEAMALFPEPIGSPEAKVRTCLECSIPLIVEQLDGVEVDRCNECGGMWLDKGELEQLRSKMEDMERRTDELIQTIALNPEDPKLRLAIDKERESSKSVWRSLARLFSFKS